MITPIDQEVESRPQTAQKSAEKTSGFKSPSDTTLYAPAVMKTRAEDPLGIVQMIQSCGGIKAMRKKSDAEIGDVADQIDAMLTSFRLDAQATNVKTQPEDELRLGESSRRRLDFEEQPGPSIRDQAHARIVEAEKYRAEIEKPTGKQDLFTGLFGMSEESQGSINRCEFPEKPILDDDEFMHITCHVEDNLVSIAENGGFLELDKVLTKYNKSFNQEESQKLEMVSKDGQVYYVPREEKSTKINNVVAWEKAFRIYMAMYARKH